MRRLLDSSWIKFGPAGRDDWVSGSPSPPTMEKQLQGYHWNELSAENEAKSEIILYIVLPLATLLVFCVVFVVLYRRFRQNKLGLANIITLDLQDPECNTEILSSLTGNAERLNSTSSDMSDGVFLMVYLPPPYEETLTKITRAASLTSGKDVESIKIEDLEAKLCPELKARGEYV
ncbi:small integral membrane protein 28-like [Myxocyprinus asiaticus]|uniref:small integral membrane protein 28-like n=1 Tax=Myxocyprinus asiaticus TaxID=70543 RepID=UPI0022230A57|nr:small integral membrane protein 28-like [Myxocyprinus asiaticus]